MAVSEGKWKKEKWGMILLHWKVWDVVAVLSWMHGNLQKKKGCDIIFKGCENQLRQILIIERYRKWIHPGWCLWGFISINSNTLLDNDVKWPMCDSNLNTDTLFLSHLIACPHCVYFFSTDHSSIRLFSAWPTGEKASESVGAICLQQTGFWHLLRTATINTVRAYVMNARTSLEF